MARDLAWFTELYARATDPASIAEAWDEEAVIEQSSDVPGTAGTFRGHDGVIALGRELAEGVTDLEWNPREVRELGAERYLVLLDVRGRGAGSGVPMQADIGHIVQLKGGRISRMKAILGWDRAAEAASSARPAS